MRGASKGEGLGNQFLAHIREVDAVAYVLRCFEDADVTHVEGRIDPLADAETVETELMLADLDSLERRREPLAKKAQVGDKEAKAQLALIDKALELLRAGKPARFAKLERGGGAGLPRAAAPHRQARRLRVQRRRGLGRRRQRHVADGRGAGARGGRRLRRHLGQDRGRVRRPGAARTATPSCTIWASRRPASTALIREGYRVLGLITYFTVGPKEARAWTVTRGTKAPKAAGAIHTDFEKGFIRAETIAYDDFVALGGEVPAKEAGKMRLEGKEYVVKDGDVMHFRFAN